MNDTKLSHQISAENAVAEALMQSLSEVTITTMLAQNFHWNVTGMAFGPLHSLFQEIYEDHFEAQDDMAERMKAIGCYVDGRLSTMLERSKIEECDSQLSDTDMIKTMLAAQETIASTLAGASDVAASHGDKLTEDMLIGRGQTHEKFAWMLRAHLS